MNIHFENSPFQLLIYTETKANNTPLIESFILPIQYATKRSTEIQLEINLKITDELQNRLDYINKNIDLYSKIVISIAGKTEVVK